MSGSDPVILEIDEEVEMVSGQSYGLSIRTPNNPAVAVQVTTVPGRTTTLSVPSPSASFLGNVSAGDLFGFGLHGRETIDGLVVSVEPRSELHATLQLVPWQSPGVYQAETGAIPPFDSGISALVPSRYQLVIEGVTSESDVLRRLGSILETGIYIRVRPIGVVGAIIEAQIRRSGTNEPYAPASVRRQSRDSIEIDGVQEGATYDLRLRWTAEEAFIAGPWAFLVGHQVISASIPPGEVTDAQVMVLPDGTRRFSWVPPLDLDLAGIQIRYTLAADNEEWDDMTKLHEGFLVSSPYDTFDPPEGSYVFSFRAVDDSEMLGPEYRTDAITLSPQRAPGGMVLTGMGPPADDLGNNVDIYVDLLTGLLWRKTTGTWVNTMVKLTGGDIFTGTNAPDASLGADGDIYIQGDGTLWRKVNGAWQNTGIDLTGTSFIELRMYRVQAATDAAPARPTGGSFRFSTAVQVVAAGWILEADIPALNAGQVLYCVAATADNESGDLWTPDTDDWTTPRIVQDTGQLNLAYARFTTIPTTAPGNSTGIPTGYYDSPDSVPPLAGSTLVYITGFRQPYSTTFTWSIPIPVLDPDSLARGRETYVVPITQAQQMTLEGLAADAELPGEFVNLANDATRGGNVQYDIVRFRRTGFSSSWIWGGSAWERLTDFIAAEEISGLRPTLKP